MRENEIWTITLKNVVFLLVYFLVTAIWLPHDQLCVIIKETASLTDVNYCVVTILTHKGHQEPRNEFGSLSLAKQPV